MPAEAIRLKAKALDLANGSKGQKTMSDRQEQEEIRRYIDKHLQRQKSTTRLVLLAVNVGVFILFSIIALLLAAQSGKFSVTAETLSKTTGDTGLAALIMLWVGWLTGLILHGIGVFMETKAGERQMRQQLALRAMITRWTDSMTGNAFSKARKFAEETDEEDEPEKRKRSQTVRLSDDGELVPDDGDDVGADEPQRKTARGAHE
jgi:hypothetical protein